MKLQGTWTAIKAERDGKAADDVVGHRLSFTGNRFEIDSKEGKRLYVGTIQVNQTVNPAAIDFEHAEGALKGRAWKGIYALDGDTLTTCDTHPTWRSLVPLHSRQRVGPGTFLSRSNAPTPELRACRPRDSPIGIPRLPNGREAASLTRLP
jgi:uncharacterized protein (TIGR03067 family)